MNKRGYQKYLEEIYDGYGIILNPSNSGHDQFVEVKLFQQNRKKKIKRGGGINETKKMQSIFLRTKSESTKWKAEEKMA